MDLIPRCLDSTMCGIRDVWDERNAQVAAKKVWGNQYVREVQNVPSLKGESSSLCSHQVGKQSLPKEVAFETDHKRWWNLEWICDEEGIPNRVTIWVKIYKVRKSSELCQNCQSRYPSLEFHRALCTHASVVKIGNRKLAALKGCLSWWGEKFKELML